MPCGSGAGVVKEPYFVEVAVDVFAFVQPDGGWCVNNAGVVTGAESTVVVDTAATIARADRLHAGVLSRSATDAPPTVVNTHFHGDHTFGNCVFGPSATIIAHEVCREEIAKAGLGLTQLWPDVAWGDITLTLPRTTFAQRMSVHTGAHEVELMHFGPAHTRGDAVAWLPSQKVLFAGDILMKDVTPFCLMGSISGSLAAIERLRELEAETVVPGHGPVCGPEVLDECAAYLRWIQQLAVSGVQSGESPVDVARQVVPPWELLDSERLLPNLIRAYAEVLGTGVDEMAAFQQMLTFHGSLPDCHA
jgi:cyclase